MTNQNSLWKYFLLFILILLGLIYAAPNLYGEDPAVQISLKAAENGKTIALDNILINRIKKILQSSELSYLNIEQEQETLLLRFTDTDVQLKARDEIARILGEQYVVALNLAPKTPHWLRALGANPMKLGLDLRGGVHFLLDVDIDSILPKGDIDQTTRDNITNYAIEQTITTLRNRVNELGVSEASVQRQGLNHVSVDLPGIQDTTRAKDIIGKTATLRFQLADTEHNPLEIMASGHIPAGTHLLRDENDRPVLLKDEVILKGTSVTYASFVSRDGRPAVNIHLGGGGETLFHRITANNIGKPLAVLYVETKSEPKKIGDTTKIVRQLKERVISVATIQSALGNDFDITGLPSQRYAENLALLLRSGALAAPVTIIQELTVGPSLGKANIHQGILSVAIGSLLVILFMLLYYRLFGLVANFALLLNIVFIVAILSILGATLTLPGIAAIVLTVGMAVDANVLINERIREELRQGISPYASIRAGYERAFSTIVDANVTTLIVALILFTLGSGAVKGFAIILIIGLLSSMLTAIFCTRIIIYFIYSGRQIKKLSIGI